MVGSFLLVVAAMSSTDSEAKHFDSIARLVKPIAICELQYDSQIWSKRRELFQSGRQARGAKGNNDKNEKAFRDALNSLTKKFELLENKKKKCGRDEAIETIKESLSKLNPDADPIYNKWYANGIFDDLKEAITWIYKYENNIWPPRPIAPPPPLSPPPLMKKN